MCLVGLFLYRKWWGVILIYVKGMIQVKIFRQKMDKEIILICNDTVFDQICSFLFNNEITRLVQFVCYV